MFRHLSRIILPQRQIICVFKCTVAHNEARAVSIGDSSIEERLGWYLILDILLDRDAKAPTRSMAKQYCCDDNSLIRSMNPDAETSKDPDEV